MSGEWDQHPDRGNTGTGAPASCKSEAAKCGLALFGVHESHCFNNQSTPLCLFKIVNKTSIPVVI